MSRRAARAIWRQLANIASHAPAARSSHSVTAVAGKLCVFGGEDAPRNAFDPFPHFFCPDGRWESSKTPLPGLPLLGHGAAGLGAKLHIFGGRLGGPNTFSGKDSGESGDLFIFDADREEWSHWKPGGNAMPEPRSFHAMCSAEKNAGNGEVFLFGGCGASGRLNDLWSFNPEASEWACLHSGGLSGAPVPRGGSSLVATADGSRLALLFGFSGAQQGDIAVFDRQKGQWKVVAHEEQLGDVPSPRSVFAAAVLQGSNKVIMFGGESVASDLGHAGAGFFTSDLYVLDLDCMEWKKLECEGMVPAPRGWGAMASLDSSRVVLFGGLDSGNTRLGDAWELTVEN